MTNVFTELLTRSLWAGVLVVLIVAFRWCFRRVPKRIHVLLWTLVALRLVLPDLPKSQVSMVPQEVSDGSAVVTFVEQAPEFVYRTIVPGAPAEVFQPQAPAAAPIPWLDICAWVWLAGMVFLGLYSLVGYLKIRRKVAASMAVGNDVYLCDYIGTPFLLGLRKPKIYLPAETKPEAAAYVLAHERAHLERRDHWWKLLGFVLLSIHWFNPLMWLAYILLCRDIEMACDEAVVQHMDLAERKAYSTALLVCSVRSSHMLAVPLAFGEGSIKARILRVLHYKKPGFWVTLAGVMAAVAVALCFLTAPVEEEPPVMEAPAETSTPETVPETTEAPGQPIRWQETFTGMDDTLIFNVDIDTHVPDAPMEQAEVELHYLTEEDVERAANALFPGCEYLDPYPLLEQQPFSKHEIQEKLDRWKSYNSEEFLNDLFLSDTGYEDNHEILDGFIENYTELYETATEGVVPRLCPWNFKKQSYYSYSEEKLAGEDLSREDYWLKVETEVEDTTVGDIPYTFLARKFENWQESEMSSYIDAGINPAGIDEYVIQSNLKRVEAPTQEQIEAIRAKAQKILDDMGLPNQWYVDSCYVEVGQMSGFDTKEYTVKATAVPVLNGVPTARAWQRSNDWEAYGLAGEMSVTDAYFRFAPSGELLYFELDSPVTLVGTEPAEVLPMRILLEKARACLTAQSYSDHLKEDSFMYGGLKHTAESTGQRILCEINITDARYGLIRMPGEGTRYTYAPALILMGSQDFVGEQSGKVYYGTGTPGGISPNRENPIVIVNAMDGTILYQ